MKSIFKRKSYIELPRFSSVTNEDVIFHIGAPKTGSTAIQKFCLDNRETLREHGFHYPEHALDKNGISGGHSALGLALIESRLDDAANILSDYVKEAKDNNCVLLLSAESIFYSPDKLTVLLGDLKFKLVAFYRAPLEALYSNYIQLVKRHFLTTDIASYCKAQLEKPNGFLTSEAHARWLEKYGHNKIELISYCEATLKTLPIQKLFLMSLGLDHKQVEKNFIIENKFVNRSYPLSALELKRMLNFVLSDEFEDINDKVDIYLQSIADTHVEQHDIESRVSKDLYYRLKQAAESNFKYQVEAVLSKVRSLSKLEKVKSSPLNAMQLNIQIFQLLTEMSEREPELFEELKKKIAIKLSERLVHFEIFKLAEFFNLEFEGKSSEWFSQGQIERMPNYEKAEFLRDIADLMYRRGEYAEAENIVNAALKERPHGPVIKKIKAKITKKLSP
ncbi:hypothetical protein FJN13_16225 [Alteromonas mediterranea]|uniref:hypothetical protein n=1 Tax=Alteromonas mediterranea TaxID=314275 RepID=UPI0011326EBD|nr:hypothetical protein [Alteromonas mediterranea]QDG36259.1 hypothetical protein FJN13_16225 [Alteromonas mediterranea]